MEPTKSKLKIVTGILAVLLVLSAAANIYYWNRINTLTASNDQDLDDTDTSLNTQTGDVDGLKNELADLQQQNGLLKEKVGNLDGMLKEANNQVWQLRTRKSNPVAVLSPVEVDNSGSSNENAMRSRVEQLNDQIAALQDSLQRLSNQRRKADNFRIVAFKRNSKETAKAKKVDKLTISLQVPAANGQQKSDTVYVSLRNLEGKGISSPLETLTLPDQEGRKPIPVHGRKVVDLSKNSNWQELTFDMQGMDAIKPGTYRASVYTRSNYMGSVEVQFRDSFWFF